MNVYTYFEPCKQIDIEDETRLLLLWGDNWRAHGFNPIVLNEAIARRNPDFDAYDAAVAELPTVNPKDYERACYIRWMALAQVGGGVMTDADVFIYDPKFRETLTSYESYPDVHFFEDFSPSCFYATREGALETCNYFANYKPDAKDIEGDGDDAKSHVSDQNALRRNPTRPKITALCLLYGKPGWEHSPLVHYSTGSMFPKGMKPKFAHIPKLRPMKLQMP